MGRVSTVNVFLVVVYATVALSTSADDGCQPGANKFQEYCYSYIAILQTFNNAHATCLSRGGQLAIIKDHNTARFIRALHKKMTALSYWIGISDRNSEGSWGYISDNSPLTYTYWNPGEPNGFRASEDCALMRIDLGLAWDDACCSCDKFLYICQFEDISHQCRNNDRFEGNCYKLSRQRAIFSEAEKHCQKTGGKLAEIKTMGVQRFLEGRIAQEEWWKDLTDQQMDQFDNWSFVAWIGVYKYHNKWMYTDGSKVDQPFWRLGQPNMEANADCVMVSDSWISTPCDLRIASFCQFKAEIRPKQAVSSADTKPTQAASSVGTKPTQAVSSANTKPTQAVSSADTKPTQAVSSANTKPPRATSLSDTRPTQAVNNFSVEIIPTKAVNDVAVSQTVFIATISGSMVILLIIAVCAIRYSRMVRSRLMSEQQPPPVPMREIRTSFHESRIQSFYSANDGYLIAQEPLYMRPRNDGCRVYDEIIDSRRLHTLNSQAF